MDRATAASRRNERHFFLALAIALAAGVIIGFARTFYLKPLFPEAQVWAPPEPFFYLHGAVFSLWILLLVAQVGLVSAGHTATHQKLGKIGVVVAAAVVITGAYGALIAAGRPGGFIGVPMPPEAAWINTR